MTSFFSFTCSCCGNLHEGSPSFGYNAPHSWEHLPEEIRALGHLGTDLCWYTEDGETHYFVRGCLEIPIHGFSEPFMWGVWVSLSEKNFNSYIETRKEPNVNDSYFGWFCNRLPYYPDTYTLKTSVRPRVGGVRPYIELEPTDHPLAIDFYNGLSIKRAQQIAESVMHG